VCPLGVAIVPQSQKYRGPVVPKYVGCRPITTFNITHYSLQEKFAVHQIQKKSYGEMHIHAKRAVK